MCTTHVLAQKRQPDPCAGLQRAARVRAEVETQLFDEQETDSVPQIAATSSQPIQDKTTLSQSPIKQPGTLTAGINGVSPLIPADQEAAELEERLLEYSMQVRFLPQVECLIVSVA